MLLLFENTLIHYIYIVFYTLISRAHPRSQSGQLLNYEQTHHTDRHALAPICAASRHDLPRLNDISVRNDRHTITNEPGNLHTHEQPHPERHQGRTPTAAPSPRRASAYMISQS